VIEHHGEVVPRHRLVAPGEVSLVDEHYGGPRRACPGRSAGTTELATELGAIVTLEAAWGREALVAALGRAVEFRRFGTGDVRSILAAGAGVATVVGEGDHLDLGLPAVPTRSLDAYRLEAFG